MGPARRTSGEDPTTATIKPYQVPALLNPRKMVWVIDCARCGAQIRMGYGTAAMVHRIVAVGGSLCATCNATDQEKP